MEINHIEVEKKYFSSAERRVQKFVDGVFNRNLNLVSVFRPAGQTHAHKIAALLPLCSLSFLEKFGAACKAANICYPPNILLSDTQLNFFQKYAIWKGKGFDFPGLAVDFALESMKDEKNLGTNLFQIHQELFNLLKKNFVSPISLEEFYSSNMKDNPIWHSQSENVSEFRSVVFNAYPKLRSPFLKEVLISQQADVQSVAFLLTEVASNGKDSFEDVKKELASFMLFDLEKYGANESQFLKDFQYKNVFLARFEKELHQTHSTLLPLFKELKIQESARLTEQKEILKKQADEEIRHHQEKIKMVRTIAQHQLEFLTHNCPLKFCVERL